MKPVTSLVFGCLLGVFSHAAPAATSLLFIGNSFTYGGGSAVRYYRANTVTDLNNEGIGGVPALFKSFTQQAGLDYDVALETRGGSGIDFHLENKLDVIGQRPWDVVVMHGQSTLDFDKPGDPAKLVATAKAMAAFLRSKNQQVSIYPMATWARADQVYPANGAWAGKSVEAMTQEVRTAYDLAATAAPGVKAVIPVGEAWIRAMQAGIADSNPYDGIEAGKVDLWTYDHYHASTHGYYLEALVIFGTLTARDPRILGETECSGFELGLPRSLVKALQQVAFEQLGDTVTPNPVEPASSANPQRCATPGQ